MRTSLNVLFVLAISVGLLTACGPKAVGAGCVGGAAENDCVEGAICTLERAMPGEPPAVPNNQTYFCRSLCDTEADCEAGFDCMRAEGTMFSSCQPEPEMSTTDGGM